MVLFVALREDVQRVVPHVRIDPRFASTLRAAKQAGVILRAARFRIGADGEAEHLGSIPVATRA